MSGSSWEKGRQKRYESVVSEELYTSLNVIEETTYILMKLRASDLTGIKKHYDLMKEMKGNEKVYEKCFNLSRDFFFSLSALDIKVLPLTLSWEEVLETMKEFRLFPNDALIAATCKYHGINEVATFNPIPNPDL